MPEIDGSGILIVAGFLAFVAVVILQGYGLEIVPAIIIGVGMFFLMAHLLVRLLYREERLHAKDRKHWEDLK